MNFATDDDLRVRSRTAPRGPWMLASLLAGQTLASTDPAVLAVAAPSIRHALRLDAGALELAVSASVLAFAALLVTGARAGAAYGARRLFLGGLAAYTAGALGAGLAGDAAVLVAARLIQGVALAAMVPQVLSIIRLHVGDGERARAMGLYAVVAGLGVALGQVLGGLLVATDAWGLGWRLAFLAAVPIGSLTLLVAARTLPRDEPGQATSADPGGAVLLPAALGLLLVPLTVGPQLGWPVWTWLCLAAGAAVMAAFVLVERRLAARGGDPLLDVRVLATPGVTAGALVVFASMGAYASLQLVVSLHVQLALGYTPLQAGLTFACYALGFGLVNLSWPHLPVRVRRWLSPAGMGLLGLAALALALFALGAWQAPVMLPVLALAGCGHGAAYGPLVHELARRLPPERVATLSGLVPTTTQVAVALGTVLMGGLYLDAPGHGLSLVAGTVAAVALATLPAAIRASGAPAAND